MKFDEHFLSKVVSRVDQFLHFLWAVIRLNVVECRVVLLQDYVLSLCLDFEARVFSFVENRRRDNEVVKCSITLEIVLDCPSDQSKERLAIPRRSGGKSESGKRSISKIL